MSSPGAGGQPDRQIETARLVLHPIPLATAEALLAGLPVPGLLAGPGWPQPDTMGGLAMELGAGEDPRTGWFVVLRDTGEVIGDCGWRGGPNGHGDAEIGYGLAAPFRGQGYGTEAVGALVGWCTRQRGVRRLLADVLPGNTPSRRLLERLGFTLLAADGDHLRYGRPGGPGVGPGEVGT